MCNLGAINLEKFVTADRQIDFDELRRVVRLAVHMLDNVIDITKFPVERVNRTARDNRRVGLGVMGLADMLYLLRVPYNSPKGRNVASDVMACIQEEAHFMSLELASLKGVFPNWEKSVFYETGELRRNAALTNVAPTGTISMMFDVSGGVEPYFALAYYYKNVLGGGVQLSYVNKHLRAALKERGVYSEELMAKIIKKGTLQGLEEVPEDIRKVFVTSMDISAEDHIAMQAAMQRHCDNAISKTINFPNSATKEEIVHGYVEAWESDCKGCTVYRNGSRDEQVLNLHKKEEPASKPATPPLEEGWKTSSNPAELKKGNRPCPDCGSQLLHAEGCASCASCGYSACAI